MKLATFRQIALGSVFAVSLVGCAGDDPARYGPPPDVRAQGSTVGVDLDLGLAQARAERHDGELKMASDTLARLMLVAPDNAEVLGEYGKILIGQGRNGEALGFLERATALEPSAWSFQSAMGVAYDQMGDHGQAQAAYERALSVKPGEPTVLSNNALSHMEQGDLETAERLLKEAAQNGADPRIKQNLAMLRSKKGTNEPSRVAFIMEMAASDMVHVAPQPTLDAMLDVTPLVDVAPMPEPDETAPMAVPEPAPALDPVPAMDESWLEDQATRGETIASDPLLTEEPVHVASEPEKIKSPKPGASSKKPPVKAVAAKTPKAKIASKKPAPRDGQDQSPLTQTASGK